MSILLILNADAVINHRNTDTTDILSSWIEVQDVSCYFFFGNLFL